MRILLFALISLFASCSGPIQQKMTKEQGIINDAIKTHGGILYGQANYNFVFRDKNYSFKHDDGKYTYTLQQKKNDREVFYELNNDSFTRSVNGVASNLSEKDKIRYSNSLNSVIYFALLPYRLNDQAAIKSYKGVIKIKGKSYHAIEVKFNEKNGGTDHEDIFMYWINEQTKTMDYLAYEFHVNGGGVRFRNAYNPRNVDGIRFQDYENYSAPTGTKLTDLPALFEKGNLKLLSKIELEKIQKEN